MRDDASSPPTPRAWSWIEEELLISIYNVIYFQWVQFKKVCMNKSDLCLCILLKL